MDQHCGIKMSQAKKSFQIRRCSVAGLHTSFKTSRAAEATVCGPLLFKDAESP